MSWPELQWERLVQPDPLGTFSRWGHYTPDLAAHERHDAEVMRLVQSKHCGLGKHAWRSLFTGTFCTICETEKVSAPAVQYVFAESVETDPFAMVYGAVIVILDLHAKEDPQIPAVLAGPFYDPDAAREFRWVHYRDRLAHTVICYVTPHEYSLLVNPQSGSTALRELTRGNYHAVSGVAA